MFDRRMTHRTQWEVQNLEDEFQNMEEDPDEDRFFVNEQFYHTNRIQWDCCILIDDKEITAYQNAVIVVTLTFPAEYPFKPPAVFFKTPVFHPYVSEETGELCSCILRENWSITNNNRHVRDVLSQLHAMIISDGDNYDDRNICINREIQELRNNNYPLFFSVIRVCLQLELPEDDSGNMTYENRGTWDECVQKQQQRRVKQDDLVTSLFQGKFDGMNSVVRRFLGLTPDQELLSEYTLASVKQPTGTIRIITSDGYRDVQRWSSIKLFDNFDNTTDTTIHIPFTTEKLSSVINLCKIEDMMMLRCVSPSNGYADDVVSQLIAPFQTYSKGETFEILKTADFLGGERIVISACLYLSHLIRRESRAIHTVASTEASNASSSRATFQTFVSLKL